MKRILMMGAAVAAMCMSVMTASAQKKVLDHSVYDSWQRVSNTAMSPDGKIIIYGVNPQVGDGELVIKQLDAKAQEVNSLSIARGTEAKITDDSKWAIIKIKAPYAETRKARIAKKKADQMPKDSLIYVNLTTLEITKIGESTAYKVPQRGKALIAYDSKVKFDTPADTTKTAAKDSTNAETKTAAKDSTKTTSPADTSAKAKAAADTTKTAVKDTTKAKKPAAKPAPKQPDIKCLVLLDPATGHSDTLRKVSSYTFDRDGKRLAVIYKKEPKDSLSADKLVLYNLPSLDSTILDEGRKYYSLPNFNIEGDKLTFLASNDSSTTGTRHCAIMLSEEITTGKGRKATTSVVTRELLPQHYQPREGWCISTNASPVFNADSKRIFLGVAAIAPPKDTTIIDFEAAQLDIWNWDVYMTPTMQRLNNGAIKDATCKAVIDLQNPGDLVMLTDILEENVTPLNAGRSDYALAIDTRSYQLTSTWDSNSYTDSYIIDMRDGSRKPFAVKLDGRPNPSPTGRYLTWYDHGDLHWYCHDLKTDTTVNLTAGLDGMFYNDEDDHPAPKPAFDSPKWLEDDSAILLTEKYDIWYVTPDGKKAECLTQGQGRATETQYRVAGLKPSGLSKEQSSAGIRKSYAAKDTVFMTTYNRISKENGFARMLASKPGLISSFTAPAGYSNMAMASGNSSNIAFLKGDINHSNDQYVTSDFWGSETKLSAINPQQSDYNWCNVQLVHWTAYDGTPLDGLLYTPEDLDPSKKYPMMVYFYEKNSQTMYSYSTPAPSRSIIGFSFYASRGYVVFVPDIVYKDGHPGESAYNCICSGAEAMCEQFPFIDKARMGIQGQSWGGYQTAYLVTRTDMFAAAGAGAPVGNMTSAYGGMRWGSGVVRAMQYEHGQSRIGKNMWEDGGLDLYIENSPVFHTQNVTTPVLIMHNDGDGAVPWYQGIEFFMALRRFEHPAWLLQYNGEAHNLNQRRNCIDLSKRLQQFFDHYLKGEPMPAWMKTGVPYHRKGQYYGFEFPEEKASGEKVNLIFETDFGNDVDDALALDIINKYVDEGKVNLLAIGLNKGGTAPVEAVDIYQTWYGHPDVPLGIIKDACYSDDAGRHVDSTNFVEAICALKDTADTPLFKRTHSDYSKLTEAHLLYRKILAGMPDQSVVIASVGFSTNLARLLDSPADEYSPLTGRELVAKKVRLLSTMAGNFADKKATEFNVHRDVAAAQKVFHEWPGAVVTSPFELGIQVRYPGESILNDFTWGRPAHPLVESFKGYKVLPYDRPSWDPTAVLYAVEGDKWFTVSEPGRITVDKRGSTSFSPSAKGTRRYLSVTEEQRQPIIDRLRELATRKPACQD